MEQKKEATVKQLTPKNRSKLEVQVKEATPSYLDYNGSKLIIPRRVVRVRSVLYKDIEIGDFVLDREGLLERLEKEGRVMVALRDTKGNIQSLTIKPADLRKARVQRWVKTIDICYAIEKLTQQKGSYGLLRKMIESELEVRVRRKGPKQMIKRFKAKFINNKRIESTRYDIEQVFEGYSQKKKHEPVQSKRG